MADQLAPSERHSVSQGERTIYQWSQTITDVDIFVPLPPGVKAKALYVDIQRAHLTVGIRPNPPYLDEALFGNVITSESTWTIDDGELQISLQKATPGDHWRGALAGHSVDASAAEADKKRLMLQRFQVEHPGFDFSGADFNGEVPDPSAFLGGMSRS